MWELLKNKAFLHATAILIGTMVGVGIFSIPLAFTKSGFLIGVLLAFLIGAVTILFNLIYAEIILRTTRRHQLVGYANKYLGKWAKRLIFFANALGIYGALLVYIHYAGGFLNNLFSEFFYFRSDFYSIAFFFVVASILPFRFKTVAAIEFFLTGLFVTVILSVFAVGMPYIDVNNFLSVVPSYWYLPYGVLLFAFAGLTSIPLQRQMLKGQEYLLKPAIIFAVIFTGLLYLLFTFTVVGVSGFSTSDDALRGLMETLGSKIVLLGSFFGVCAIATSFLMLGTALKDIFVLDYRLKRNTAWALVVLPPFVLYVGGLRSAVDIISLVGAVAIGLEAVILLFMFRKAKQEGDRDPEFSFTISSWVTYVLGLMFLVGIVFILFIRE